MTSTPGSPKTPPPATPDGAPGVSVVVPTYREVENLRELVAELARLKEQVACPFELVLVDDDSRDGTVELIESLGLPWVRLIVRTSERGLSQAVLEGLRRARYDTLVVMDADLSHPASAVPELLTRLERGADFAVGSRFVEGGSTDDDWGIFRWLNSRIATLLAMPLVRLADPMSGFFALRRETFQRGEGSYDPVGYKIGLELMVRARCERVVEVPIHFSDRRRGQSKLTLREQLKYLQHVRRLYIHRFGTWSYLAQFLAVGLSGAVVNLLVLTLAVRAGLTGPVAVALAIGVSLVSNFTLNRRFTFSYARSQPLVRQFAAYAAASSIGVAVNYATTLAVWDRVQSPALAGAAGIVAGTGFNFLMSRFLVFKAKHVKK